MTHRNRLPAALTTTALICALGAAGPPATANENLPPGQTTPPMIANVKAATSDIVTVSDIDGGKREDTTDQVKLVLGARVLFAKDSAELSAAAISRIRQSARAIKRQGADRVTIAGYTDNLGPAAHGTQLSQARARAVRDALAKTLGKDITYTTHGYGERDPVADNTSEKNREKNRRVEITFPRQTAHPPSDR